MTDYKPGDVVNGHVLGNDGSWHPISAPPGTPPAAPIPPPGAPAHSATDGEEKAESGGVLKGCLTLIVVLIILGFLANACSGGDDKAEESKPETSASMSADERAEAKASAKAEAEEKAEARRERQRQIDEATFPSERDLALVFKDPDSHVGEVFQVWGSVTQFDAATGNESFLADVANRNTTSYGYFEGENSLFVGSAKAFKNLVEEDVFTATVEVAGSESYDTQIGGNTTVPKFKVLKIKTQ